MTKEKPTTNDVKIVLYSWIGWVVLGLGAMGLLAYLGRCVRDCVIEVIKNHSGWEAVVIALIGMVSSLALPLVSQYFQLRYIRKFTRDTVGRVVKLEEERDPARTSSNLNPDGTDPPGGSL